VSAEEALYFLSGYRQIAYLHAEHPAEIHPTIEIESFFESRPIEENSVLYAGPFGCDATAASRRSAVCVARQSLSQRAGDAFRILKVTALHWTESRGSDYSNHIYWDQASVLVQIGLLDSAGWPVTRVESARKVSNQTCQATRSWPDGLKARMSPFSQIYDHGDGIDNSRRG
jgi:hypothetical protein